MSSARQGFRRLRRTPDGQVIAGLCAGVGRELRVDPVLLRVVLVLLTIYGGAGLVVYLAAWALIPMGEPAGEPGERTSRGASVGAQRRRFVICLVALIACVILLPWWGLGWEQLTLLLLAMLGVYLLLRRGPDGAPAARPEGDPQRTDAAAAAPSAPATPTADAPSAATGSSAATGASAATGSSAATGAAARERIDGTDTMPLSTSEGAAEPHGGKTYSAGATGDAGEDQRPTGPMATSWRSFGPAPTSFWEQADPLGLREPATRELGTGEADSEETGPESSTEDPWARPDPLGLHDDTVPMHGDTTRLPGESPGTGQTGTGQTSTEQANAGQPGAGRRSAIPRARGRKERPGRGRRFALMLCTLLGALLAAVSVHGTGDTALSAYVAAPLGVIGLGLVIGTWVGRSMTLIVSGSALLLALLPAVASDLLGAGFAPSRHIAAQPNIVRAPTTAGGVESRYEFGSGSFRLDLAEVPFRRARPIETRVEMVTGNTTVVVPPHVDVRTNIEMISGTARLFGDQTEGVGLERSTWHVGADGEGGGRLTLWIENGTGTVEVRRASE